MSDCTPVFGNAEESLDEAPTHQTEPAGGLPLKVVGWGVAFNPDVAEFSERAPPTKMRASIRYAHLILDPLS
jgi:hypothetical protein